MATVPFIQFNIFAQNLGDGVHDLNTDVLAIYLSDTAPNVATAQVKADVPEIATGHGYGGPVGIDNLYSQTSGVGILTSASNKTITAAGGSIGPFRYIVLCNTSKSGSPLIAYYDYGSEVTLLDTQSFRVNFGANVLTIPHS